MPDETTVDPMFIDPVDFPASWYKPDDIRQAISSGVRDIPKTTDTEEFANWMCNEYRLAMGKGISLANGSAITRIYEHRDVIESLLSIVAYAISKGLPVTQAVADARNSACEILKRNV
ncbi:MAG: hypothetical protein E6R03_14220 [Hyphomicrobiaceae bacterium]|nr:MAG: hypothetical protein E6R03_14220 [Hyphomicrobiaceae bacterium]